jgi:hypothetical protein
MSKTKTSGPASDRSAGHWSVESIEKTCDQENNTCAWKVRYQGCQVRARECQGERGDCQSIQCSTTPMQRRSEWSKEAIATSTDPVGRGE